MISAKGRSAARPPDTGALDVDRVYHEIRQCLRITGVPRYFDAWAEKPRLLGAVWLGARPAVETRAFEEAADRVRAEAVALADPMGRLSALGRAGLGESQAFQAQAAVLLFHYLDAKLLVLNAAVQLALEAAPVSRDGGAAADCELVERGASERMAMLEAVDEKSPDHVTARVFRELKKAPGGRLPSDALQLALWPGYLEAAWERLRPLAAGQDYARACARLRELSRALAAALPRPVSLGGALGSQDAADAAALAREYQGALPGAVLNAALLALDWQAPEILRRSPFPAPPRGGQEEP